ncbi:MAG: glycoside hydrolase family 38 C-terminal domain-containing protein, partial [Bacilli bacterium]
GEARSPKLGRIHAGITSTRMDIKAAMAYYERFIFNILEPSSMIVSALSNQDNHALLNHFLKILFKNQFHDSIYSSSPETINQTVSNRILQLRHGLNEAMWLNHRYIIKNLKLEPNQELITIFNPCGLDLDNHIIIVNGYFKNKDFTIRNEFNENIHFQILNETYHPSQEIENYTGLLNLNDEYKVANDKLLKLSLALEIDHLKAMSYQVLNINYEKEKRANAPALGLENQYLKLEVVLDGSLSVYNKITKQSHHHLFQLELSKDEGDEYNYAPPLNNQIVSSEDVQAHVLITEDNDLLSRISITHKLSFDQISFTSIQLVLTLKKDSPIIECEAFIDNENHNCFLQLLIPSLKNSLTSYAQDHYAFITRSNDIDNSSDVLNGLTSELQLPLYPFNDLLMLQEDDDLYILSKSLGEYQIKDNHIIALSLLRSVDMLGKEDLTTRPGRASGYHLNTPSSLLLTSYSLSFALGFNPVDKLKTNSIYQHQSNALHIKEITSYEPSNIAASSNSLIKIDERLSLLAFKKSEDLSMDVLRVNNFYDYPIKDAIIEVDSCYKSAYLLNSLEDKALKLNLINGKIVINEINQYSFISIGLKRSH